MRVYISADIEGIAGITDWQEAVPDDPSYPPFRDRMTLEVAAACRGAIAAGASEIVVKDAHGPGRNIDPERLPDCVSLIRGWSGHHLGMVQGIDTGFDALVMLGYHAAAGAGGNPLAHTITSRLVAAMTLNGQPASEFLIYAWAAALHGVPTVFLSGDAEICAEAQAVLPAVTAVPVSAGQGRSSISIAPAQARAEIEAGVAASLRGPRQACLPNLPPSFALEVTYLWAYDAYRYAQYPGAELASPTKLRLSAPRYEDVLTALSFIT